MSSQSRFTDDLSRKMFETLDLKTNPQKPNMSFQQPTHKIGKRPQTVVHKSSNKAANWSNMNLEDDFVSTAQNYQPSIFKTQDNTAVYNQTILQNNAQILTQNKAHIMLQNSAYNMSQNNVQTTMNWQLNMASKQQDDDFGDFFESTNVPNSAIAVQQVPSMTQSQSAQNVLYSHGLNNNTTQFGNSYGQMNFNSGAYGQVNANSTQNISTLQTHSLIQTQNQSNSTSDDFGDFSEFSSPLNKSNTFSNTSMHKPTLRQDVPPPKTETDYRRIVNSPPIQNKPKVQSPPLWVTNPAQVPELYRQVLGNAGLPNGMVDTSILYPILISSSLSQQTLGEIWAAVNKKTPGQLTYSEMFVALNLIALAQKSIQPLTWEKSISYRTPLCPNIMLNSANKSNEQNNTTTRPVVSSDPGKLNASTFSKDDFGDFQSVAEPILPVPFPEKSVASSTLHQKAHNSLVQNTSSSSATSLNSPTTNTTDLLKISLDDKYSAFRDVTLAPVSLPSVFDMPNHEKQKPLPVDTGTNNSDLLNVTDDFADFQSSDDYVDVNTVKKNSVNPVIAPMNDGSSILCEKDDKYDLFSTWDASSINSTVSVKPVMMNPLSDFNAMYVTKSVPVALNQIENKTEEKPMPQIPIKVKSPVMPRIKLPDVSKVSYFSDTEDDFGDFAEPPPIDANLADDEFDTYAAGNSSLHDFDALDHFEEEKRQVNAQTKTQMSKPKQNTTKVDQTAFSQFSTKQPMHQILTSTEPTQNALSDQLKKDEKKQIPDHLLGDGENWGNFSDDNDPISDPTNDSDWGDFSDDQNEPPKPTIDPKWTTSTHLTMSEMINESISVIDAVSKPKNDAIKIELDVVKPPLNPVVSQNTVVPVVDNNTESDSELDPEVADIKARMQGKGSVNPLDLYSDHWSRCLTTCNDIIKSANDIFSELKSPIVCKQVVNSKRGRDFIADVSEVYGVSRRIKRSMTEVGLKDDEIIKLTKEIDFAWNNLLGFCPYTPSVHKTPEHLHNMENSENKNTKYCGLCLLDTSKDDTVDYPMSISYGDRGYHAACANLWLNQVAPMLPRLELSIIKDCV